jgi:hypothetical protein
MTIATVLTGILPSKLRQAADIVSAAFPSDTFPGGSQRQKTACHWQEATVPIHCRTRPEREINRGTAIPPQHAASPEREKLGETPMRMTDLPVAAQDLAARDLDTQGLTARGLDHGNDGHGDGCRAAIVAEQQLDHALEDTFPASDPLSSNRFN